METFFEIINLTVGQLSTNCCLVIDKKTLSTLIIDPGDDADYIERIIADRKCSPKLILATHGHFDHILAVTELKLVYQIPFYINYHDTFLVKNMKSSVKYFLGIEESMEPQIDGYLKEGDIIKIGKTQLQVFETPGHTPGSVCLYSNRSLFCGDLLFAEGNIGRTDFSYSSMKLLQESIKKILKLPEHTQVYSGHGQSFSIRSWIEMDRSASKDSQQ